MFKKYLVFNIVFLVIVISQLSSIYFGYSLLHVISKVLITLSLMVILVLKTKLKGRFHKRIFTGLIFAMMGDIFLLFDTNTSYFMAGLTSFLIGHLCYISAFYLDFRSAPELDKRGARIAIITGVVLSYASYFWLRPTLGPLRLPVLVYIFVITLMMMMAAFRNKRVNSLSFNLILTGAFCFMASDALLAGSRFGHAFPSVDTLVMLSYMIAQYLIIVGATERKLLAHDTVN